MKDIVSTVALLTLLYTSLLVVPSLAFKIHGSLYKMLKASITSLS